MSMTKSRCQCLSSCQNEPLKGEAFCKKHLHFCPRRAPTNGYEPPYEPELWNHPILVKAYNCFAFAFNIRDKAQEEKCKSYERCKVAFHQPGSIAGYPPINEKKTKTCPNIIARMMGDNKILPSAFELKCPAHMSKIGLMIDPNQDYHFVRQNPPSGRAKIGYFSGKSGEMPVTDLDAQGHKIFDVELANFDYRKTSDSLRYTEFCGYFCVSRKKVYAAIGGRTTRRKPSSLKRRSRKTSS